MCVCIYIYVCKLIYVYIYIYILICRHIYMCVLIYVCLCIFIVFWGCRIILDNKGLNEWKPNVSSDYLNSFNYDGRIILKLVYHSKVFESVGFLKLFILYWSIVD